MSQGTVNDPRMNSEEKDYGILIAEEIDDHGRFKEIVYLKDNESRHFTFGTPVKFNTKVGKVKVSDPKKKAAVEIATDVIIDKDQIKFHPIINNLNIYAKVLLRIKDEGLLENLVKIDPEVLESKLYEMLEELLCPSQNSIA